MFSFCIFIILKYKSNCNLHENLHDIICKMIIFNLILSFFFLGREFIKKNNNKVKSEIFFFIALTLLTPAAYHFSNF